MSWYNSSWLYRKKITVKSVGVDATLTDFPIYLDLSQLGLDFHSNVRSDGGDIRITQADGETELPREVVSINTAEQEGEVHFKANSLSDSENTEFYIYYGNGSAQDYTRNAIYGLENVWTNGYTAVLHLEEDSATETLDSTANNNDGSFEGGLPNTASGKISNAQDMDGEDDHVSIPHDSQFNPSDTGEITWSVWAYPRDVSGWQAVMTKNRGGSTSAWILLMNGAPGDWRFGVRGNDAAGNDVQTNQWTYLTATLVRGSTHKIFENGTETGSSSASNTTEPDSPIIIGGAESVTEYFDGILDEVRISNVIRADQWISTEHNNQSDPGEFFEIGEQEQGEVDGSSFNISGIGDVSFEGSVPPVSSSPFQISGKGSVAFEGYAAEEYLSDPVNGSTGELTASYSADLVLDAEASGTNEVSYSDEVSITPGEALEVVEGHTEADLVLDASVHGTSEVSYSDEVSIAFQVFEEGEGATQADLVLEAVAYGVEEVIGNPIEVIVPMAGHTEADLVLEAEVHGETPLFVSSEGYTVAEIVLEAEATGEAPGVDIPPAEGYTEAELVLEAETHGRHPFPPVEGHTVAELVLEAETVGYVPGIGYTQADLVLEAVVVGESPFFHEEPLKVVEFDSPMYNVVEFEDGMPRFRYDPDIYTKKDVQHSGAQVVHNGKKITHTY